MKGFLMRFFGLFLVLFVLVQSAKAQEQNDSTREAVRDSVLMDRILQTNELLSSSDSMHMADSIAQILLIQQIEQLKASDAKQKLALQASLDSLQDAQEKRNLAMKQQIDSVRANTVGIPVVVFKDTLFFVYAKLGPFTPHARAESITQKLESLVDQRQFDPKKLIVFKGVESDDVMHDEMFILSITDRDAFWMGTGRGEVAELYKGKIIQSIADYQDRNSVFEILKRIGLLILVLAVFFFSIKYLNKGMTHLTNILLEKGKPYIKALKFRNYEFIPVERAQGLIQWLLVVFKWFVILVLLYLILPSVFSIFPATTPIAETLFGLILDPVIAFGSAVVGYIPELFSIAVIIAITHYVVKGLKFLATEVRSGKLQIPGFDADWARPTFNLLKIIIYAFSFIVIFPYLPGSDSPVFKGVSVFFGLLISIGSSSAISNIIAGLVITYMNAFKRGDRVKIGDTVGDILEKTMLVTRLRTIKNEEVTIPNSAILNGATINYTASAKGDGLILNSMVTIGYDVPWPKVHELLIAAATKCEFIKEAPKPFVLQTSLDDFYVSYQINAYTANPDIAISIYSQLHANIQDAFNNAGIEILSPHYRADRDGNTMGIPPEYRPDDYVAPPFNVNVSKDGAS